jgi:hypothetical protein
MLGQVVWSPETSERASHAAVMLRVTAIAKLGTEGSPLPPGDQD